MKTNHLHYIVLLATIFLGCSCSEEIEKELTTGKTAVTIEVDGEEDADSRTVSFTGGTAYGEGLYDGKERPTVGAEASDGYEIDYFYGGPSDEPQKYNYTGSGSSVSYQVFLNGKDHKFKCKFKEKKRTLTLTANPTSGGTVTGGGTYKVKTNIPITAVAKSGYTFSGWTVTKGDAKIMNASSASTTVQLQSSNSTLQANYTLDDASPVYVEAILMPVGTAEGITVNVHVDGRDFTYALPPTHVWNPGMIYTYTLNMKSGYNCEVDVDHVPMDEEYWSTFGKTDRIVMRDCGTDRIYIWPNYTFYGYDTYTGEGKVWGFFLRYRNRGGGEDFAGQARFVLMDGDRIVEQYQPFDIKCGNGAWDGYCKYCYVQAVPGTYRLAVLFKKNGESAWFKPYGYDQNSNDGEWMYEVRPATDMPALRMITLENQKCNTFLAYPVPDNDWFNIVYTLSNKSRKAMKGTVKVVWEREFKLESNSYRPSDKKENKIDDYEWRDELGSCTVDIAAGVRFWKGIVSCKFPIQRANPRDPVSGVGYCTPIAHLYYREEGSCEWKLLRCDTEYLFNRNYPGSESAKMDEAFNYLGIIPQSW